jgi:hypothetical protein
MDFITQTVMEFGNHTSIISKINNSKILNSQSSLLKINEKED